MSIQQKICKEKMCQVLFMSKEINCIDKWFVIKNSACLALIFNLSNLRMTTLHEKNQVKDEKYDKSFTFFFFGLTDTNLWLSD